MSRLFALLWIGWTTYFAVVEGLAFALRRLDLTLSDFTWRFEGTGWTAAELVGLDEVDSTRRSSPPRTPVGLTVLAISGSTGRELTK